MPWDDTTLVVAEITNAADLTAIQTGLPAPSSGWTYRSFQLNASDGLTGKGYLRVKITQ